MASAKKKTAAKAEPKHRKAVRKDEVIRIRVTAEQKTILLAAAEKDGSGLSFWLLAAGLRAARGMEQSQA